MERQAPVIRPCLIKALNLKGKQQKILEKEVRLKQSKSWQAQKQLCNTCKYILHQGQTAQTGEMLL